MARGALVGRTRKSLREPQGPRAFREEIQRCLDQVLTSFENLMWSFRFINLAYDLSRRFGLVHRSSFHYDQKYMRTFYASTSYCPYFRGAQ